MSFDPGFSFKPDTYYPTKHYRGAFSPRKHFYPAIAEMNTEEAECARALEMNARVKYWVRNLVRDVSSFRLPTSTDYFYPDFVAMLEDGRTLVVEYKGILNDPKDVDEKENIGQLWADLSKGRGLFLMAWKDKDGRDIHGQIDAVLDDTKIKGRKASAL